jgi:hypothetical protein
MAAAFLVTIGIIRVFFSASVLRFLFLSGLMLKSHRFFAWRMSSYGFSFDSD